jgi:serine/threonine protein kinase
VYTEGEKVQGYTIADLITIGNNSVAYAAADAAGRKVFFKAYQSPSIRVKWYRPFIDHQREMKARIEGSSCRQFCYQFLGGFEHARKFHQVFEFLDKSHSLQKILDRVKSHPGEVPWASRELMAKVLVAGIVQLHAAGVVHADLKPDNIMLIEDTSIAMRYRLKIIDMDFSFFTDRKAPWDGFEGYFGTPGYMSPEHGAIPLPASDVFTLGIILYQLLGPGHPYPFDDNDKILAAYRAYAAEEPELAGEPSAPARAAEVGAALHRCLHPDPRKRPTASELHKTLLGEKAVPPPPPVAPAPARPSGPLPVATPAAPASPVGRLVLIGPDGAELAINARLAVGRTVLTTKFGEGGRYAADRQFVLDKQDDGWFVEPVAGTTNATLLDCEVLTALTRLAPGAVIGVGSAVSKRSKLDMQVKV